MNIQLFLMISLSCFWACKNADAPKEEPFEMPVEELRSPQQEAALRERLKKRKEAAFSNREAEKGGREICHEKGPLLQNACLGPIPEGLMLLYESTSPTEEYAVRFEIALNGSASYVKHGLDKTVLEEFHYRLSTPEVKRLDDALKKCDLCDLRSALYKPQLDAGVVTVKMRLSRLCGVTLWSNEWQGSGKACLDALKPLFEKEE